MVFFPFLALRGSAIKPPSLVETVSQRTEAQELEQASTDQLDSARDVLDEVSRELKKRETATELSVAELHTLVSVLQQRVEQLEAVQLEAQKDLKKRNQELIYTVKQLACGGIAGATARTVVCPMDRVKILMQTQYVSFGGEQAKYTSIVQTCKKILEEEGISKLWRGNLTNVFRVVPYSATQFASYDYYKTVLFGDKLSTWQRLSAGALAGMTATTITYPLDVIRLRLNVQPELRGAMDAARSVWAEAGAKTLFKGYFPTILSLSPFIAINFACFDSLKNIVYPDPNEARKHTVVLGLGAAAGLFAQTCCYPLDTVRRRMQMKGTTYPSTYLAFQTIFQKEGMKGFYKGMVPNAVKVVPNNAIRFLVYEFLREKFGVQKKAR